MRTRRSSPRAAWRMAHTGSHWTTRQPFMCITLFSRLAMCRIWRMSHFLIARRFCRHCRRLTVLQYSVQNFKRMCPTYTSLDSRPCRTSAHFLGSPSPVPSRQKSLGKRRRNANSQLPAGWTSAGSRSRPSRKEPFSRETTQFSPLIACIVATCLLQDDTTARHSSP